MDQKKVLLSVKDLHVKFRVRGRTLTAIRGISLDFYEGESIAIVGESGSGKSVFTKTFAGMLDGNGYISQGSIIFNDEELADTCVVYNNFARNQVKQLTAHLNEYSKLELGAEIYQQMQQLKQERKDRGGLSPEETEALTEKINSLKFKRTELFNQRQTVDSRQEKARYKEMSAQIKAMDAQIKELGQKEKEAIAAHKQALANDTEYNAEYARKMAELKAEYAKKITGEISNETRERNEILAKEMYLSVGRFGLHKRMKNLSQLREVFKKAMTAGADLNNEKIRNELFDQVVFRVRYMDETPEKLHGTCVLNLAKIKYGKDWTQIRGGKIATVFQDPMTSLNPIITIGKQITSVILQHQNCTEAEARARALILMKKVGIPNAESRFDDYPFQYSGGMRQRIVIAIALSCQPKILICDEPTTALDVTIQAQILELINRLKVQRNLSVIFITHDLGVVANMADDIAVMYAGKIVEYGTAEDVFYDPRHPYTWALLSSMPDLDTKEKLDAIPGTPPNMIYPPVGDAFADRNKYAMQIDFEQQPPMFQISETHKAATWLLHPDAPKVEMPKIITERIARMKQKAGGAEV